MVVGFLPTIESKGSCCYIRGIAPLETRFDFYFISAAPKGAFNRFQCQANILFLYVKEPN